MPLFTRRCKAPCAYHPSLYCDREFQSPVETKLYCSITCANRAHRQARIARERGLGYASASKFRPPSVIEAEARRRGAEAARVSSQPSLHQSELDYLFEMQKNLEEKGVQEPGPKEKEKSEDSLEANLQRLGFGVRKSEPSASPRPQTPDFDPSAEPKANTKPK